MSNKVKYFLIFAGAIYAGMKYKNYKYEQGVKEWQRLNALP